MRRGGNYNEYLFQGAAALLLNSREGGNPTFNLGREEKTTNIFFKVLRYP